MLAVFLILISGIWILILLESNYSLSKFIHRKDEEIQSLETEIEYLKWGMSRLDEDLKTSHALSHKQVTDGLSRGDNSPLAPYSTNDDKVIDYLQCKGVNNG